MAAGINDTFRQVGIAVGIAVWGTIFVARGADKVAELAAGTRAASGERPRQLVGAASSGTLDQALAAVPPEAQQAAARAAGEGFLAGLNAVLTLAALLSFAGAVLVLWLVRGHELERAPIANSSAGSSTSIKRPHDQPTTATTDFSNPTRSRWTCGRAARGARRRARLGREPL